MDIEYLLWLQGIRLSSPAPLQSFFEFLGSSAALIALLVVPCLVYWCVDKRAGQTALLAYGSSLLCNQLLKNTFCCYRPWVRDARIVTSASARAAATGYSFPSGHTQAAASMLGGMGWARRKKRWPLVAGFALTLLMGFSRNFLGVHTPQDVLVGLVVGLAFVLAADRLLPWADAKEGRDLRILAGGLVLVGCSLAYAALKPYPVDYVDGVILVDPGEMLVDCYKTAGAVAGVLVGWVVERRFVRFETSGLPVSQIATRMVVGVAITLMAYLPVGHLLTGLLGSYAGQFVRHLLTFVLAVAGIPALFGPLGRMGRPRGAVAMLAVAVCASCLAGCGPVATDGGDAPATQDGASDDSASVDSSQQSDDAADEATQEGGLPDSWPAECFDRHGDATVFALLEEPGANLVALLGQQDYVWSERSQMWVKDDGSSAVAVLGKGGTPLTQDAVSGLEATSEGSPVAYRLVTSGYSSVRRTYEALVSNVVTVRDVELSDEAGVALVEASDGRGCVVVVAPSNNVFTVSVYDERAIAAGLLDEASGRALGATATEAFEAISARQLAEEDGA